MNYRRSMANLSEVILDRWKLKVRTYPTSELLSLMNEDIAANTIREMSDLFGAEAGLEDVKSIIGEVLAEIDRRIPIPNG